MKSLGVLVLCLVVTPVLSEEFQQCIDRCGDEHIEQFDRCPSGGAARIKCKAAADEKHEMCTKKCEESDKLGNRNSQPARP